MQTLPDKVLAQLKAGNALTTAGVIGLFGHIQLAHAVFKLRQRGHTINARRFKAMNGKSYAEYRLEEKPAKNKAPEIGDRVRVVAKIDCDSTHQIGDEGVVTAKDPNCVLGKAVRVRVPQRNGAKLLIYVKELEVI